MVDNKRFKIQPKHVFALVIMYLVSTWILSYLIDIRNIFNLQRYVRNFHRGLLWFQLYKEAQITEILQWSFLGSSMLMCGYMWGKLKTMGSQYTYKFFLFMGLGSTIMMMEDAGNVRHNMKEYTHYLFGATTTVTVMTEMVFYTMLGAIMMFAIIGYGPYVWHAVKTRFYLITGFGAYMVASIASATRDINDWYEIAGKWIHEVVFHNIMLDRFGYVGFYIMDVLIEESIELIGASAIFCGIFAYLRFIEDNKELIDQEYQLNGLFARLMRHPRSILVRKSGGHHGL